MLKSTCKGIILFVLVVVLPQSMHAQNRTYAQEVIDTLTSPYFFGRGYLKNGDQKAAEYLREQFSKKGLLPVGGNYFHPFRFNVNTFPSEPIIISGETHLKPGEDFIVNPNSGLCNQLFEHVILVDAEYLSKKRNFKKLIRRKFKNTLVVLDTLPATPLLKDRKTTVLNKFKGSCLAETVTKLTWSVSTVTTARAGFQVMPAKINPGRQVTVNIQNNFKFAYTARNVAGYFPGKLYPDSFLIFCGHYDHLGGMGNEVYFPGANDNASGIAMMLDLMDYYKHNQPDLSVAFIAFAAEEAGLIGSYYWVRQADSLIPLKNIKFLINMDLMGSGDEGIMAVNGAVFTQAYQLLDSINKVNTFLPAVKARGKAANSDHYFFTEAGVPCFFFYLMGNYRHYHDVQDNGHNLKLGPFYDKAFLLIRHFADSYLKK